MKVWNDLSDLEISEVLEREISKAQHELTCARADIEKAQSRLKFVLTAVHHQQKVYRNESTS
jgi:hypothetical protein